ncbi:hypothetical protein BHE74_00051667 [Ensete ventricosum]|nr:hypothetical protein BHE74_00051667 [Ensete ventricosum]
MPLMTFTNPTPSFDISTPSVPTGEGVEERHSKARPPGETGRILSSRFPTYKSLRGNDRTERGRSIKGDKEWGGEEPFEEALETLETIRIGLGYTKRYFLYLAGRFVKDRSSRLQIKDPVVAGSSEGSTVAVQIATAFIAILFVPLVTARVGFFFRLLLNLEGGFGVSFSDIS